MLDANVYLRQVLDEDSASYFKWINDKELVSYNGNYRPIMQEEHDQWFRDVVNYSDNKTFSIVENHHQKLIGTCSLRNINLSHRNAELQIRIGERDFQNRGMGTQAVKLLVEYGFEHMQLVRVYLYVFSHNVRAIKAYQNSSFEYEGTLKKAACINNEFIDLILMARVK